METKQNKTKQTTKQKIKKQNKTKKQTITEKPKKKYPTHHFCGGLERPFRKIP